MTNNVYKRYVHKDVREDLSKVLLPLERIGLDIVKFLQDGKVSETVEKDEIKAFAPSVNLQSETVDTAECCVRGRARQPRKAARRRIQYDEIHRILRLTRDAV